MNKFELEDMIDNLRWAYSVCPRYTSFLELANLLSLAEEKRTR